MTKHTSRPRPLGRRGSVVLCLALGPWLLSSCDSGKRKNKSDVRTPATQGSGAPAVATPSKRLQPQQLAYVGAFRVPAAAGFARGGYALTYYPKGDPGGAADGHPGSLFITGSQQQSLVAEISVPVPKPGRSPGELNVATQLQGFTDVRGRMFDFLTSSMRVVGMAYVPKQGQQTSDKLHLAWGQHHHDGDRPDSGSGPSHMWCDLDLGNLAAAGAWHIENHIIYSVNDYLFTLPEAWAGQHAQGRVLATGRYLEGGWSGMGPSLHLIAPWASGNPPAPRSKLPDTVLLQYTSTLDDMKGSRMNGYSDADDWDGGAWLTAKDRAAVVFAGTKAVGDKTWYGTTKRPCDPCPEDPHLPEKGWWSDRFAAQLVFYDPADFARVAAGTMKPDAPQPYGTLDINSFLLSKTHQPDLPLVSQAQQMDRVGSVAYDRQRNHLFIVEPFGDLAGERPVIHVLRVR